MSASKNPMGLTAKQGVDHSAVRLARKKANVNHNATYGTNSAKPGVSLSRPTAKSSAAQPMGIGVPAKTSRAKLNRKTAK